MKIVLTAKMSKRHQEKLEKAYPQHDFYFYDRMKEAATDVKDTHVLVTYGEDLTFDNVQDMQNLRWIQVLSAGMDTMPLSLLAERGVLVTNASGIHKIPMAEYTFGVMLQVARKMNELYEKQCNSEWDRSIRVEELYGKTLGIIGVGAIGEEIALRAQVFGMQVLGVNRSGKMKSGCDEMYLQTDLLSVLPRCDYVVVIVPLTEETRNMIGYEEIKVMKENAVLINIARGAIINEEALLEHLRSKKLKMAVLDVFSEEPLPASSPFWQLENCLVTPHISGRSPLYMERALEIFHHNLALYNNEETKDMINVINLRQGY
ncbi:D-2-hydroxyacid dehydrogenase [Aneurinibacillus aneurinilyticus]|jgi:phosphoglycerate dehydrogenase-like enzyme|uniref:D-2-hydroxyacid dehydrogenase n=2 Tax=Aneurinibacillus aneurinilyticus TaxID=1391 RepID=A0A848CUR2_ANEAE|nr:D-2-hydroxyacid dehydrogenase [Aneurinibacillus aneurinilyticus]ERI09638.1 4-phosphoerythronate dehydrogenase [Aneurinibacillus aneurinilyticus ATCC 12856]MCI1696487.1 D-2-hydroxyacid dehydrogenase [Aneurinibacillus aneurinilyticus]MED0709551.1 D-2-hydroxyacid dehydrogenase [Aneurinibacillus aneurinilyticus]MED0725954.1 D-2-hydroxyacid dehydrogenase [Aneurinibacillus aneurinilyticus]MED0730961.1 D-2-hydroxyacid dehydrogenase [Aneurinibacillus aneurinilyticus]